MRDLMKYSFFIDIHDICITISDKITCTYHTFLSCTYRKQITNIEHRTISSRKCHTNSSISMVRYEIFFTITICILKNKIIYISSTYIYWISEGLIETGRSIDLIIWETYDRVTEIDGQIISTFFERLRPFSTTGKLKESCIFFGPS